jgi:(p)ppGpp synthase/HD superfamily hydrolase
VKTIADQTSLAIEIAARAHQGQMDKSGEPYILHPLRVVAAVARAWKYMHPALRQELESLGYSLMHLRAAAALHDVIEDTNLTSRDLFYYSIDSLILPILEALTRSKDETYSQFIERVKLHPAAIHIKLLDLQDNMNRGRGSMTKDQHEGLLRRYAKARAKLEAYLFERIESLTEDLVPQNCTRPSPSEDEPHEGPCNGWPCDPVRKKLMLQSGAQ